MPAKHSGIERNAETDSSQESDNPSTKEMGRRNEENMTSHRQVEQNVLSGLKVTIRHIHTNGFDFFNPSTEGKASHTSV